MSPSPARVRPGLPGILALGLWLGLAGTMVAYLFRVYDPDLMATYAPVYLAGLWTTVQLVALSALAGAVISVPVAMGRRSGNAVARGAAGAFVSFFRGTPLVAQLFLVYYGFGAFRSGLETVGLWWFFREAWYCAIFSLALNSAAYQAEILRGAVDSVAKGQWEAARALGLPRGTTFVRIVLPQAMIVALRPYANEVVLLVKASAIVAIITIFDLFGETRRAYSRTFDFQTYIWAALLYLALVETLRHLTDVIERRLTRHLVR